MLNHCAYDRAQYAEAVLSLGGCVGYWRLDETSGTTARALAGSNGTYTGSPVLAKPSAVRDGATIGLNGSSMYVVVGDSDDFSVVTTNGMTWSFWTKPTNTTTSHVVAKGAGSGSWEWSIMRGLSPIFADGAAFVAQMWQSSGNSYAVVNTGANSAPNGQWVHVVATIRYGVELVIYLDGAQKGRSVSFSGTMVNGTSAVNIGRRPDNTRYYNGDVGDLAIHNRALNANEVAWLYEEGLR